MNYLIGVSSCITDMHICCSLSRIRLSLCRFRKHLWVLSRCCQGQNWETNLRAIWEAPAPHFYRWNTVYLLCPRLALLSLKSFFIPSASLSNYLLIYFCVCMHVEVRGWHAGVSSLLPCGFQGQNSGCQTGSKCLHFEALCWTVLIPSVYKCRGQH